MKSADLIKTYINQQYIYEKYSESLSGLLKNLLYNANIKYQQITYRAKNPKNLSAKLYRKSKEQKTYNNLDEITDLAGVRIIIYFRDDIKKVIKVLEKNFKIHNKYSVCLEQEIRKKPHEFKYKSEHRIISLKKDNLNILQECKKFHNLKCEIQIRTVLQHAWAEIEHGIGYKPKLDAKEITRSNNIKLARMFAQNSALLEIADENFVQIKNHFSKYKK